MSFWKLFYHVVFAVKNREALLCVSIQEPLYRVVTAKISSMRGVVHAVGGMEDHIHIAFSAPPSIAPATLVGQVKGSSSHYINENWQLSKPFTWQEEYGILSFGERNLTTVVRYIQNQRQHHTQQNIALKYEILEKWK
jgi:putative transposase